MTRQIALALAMVVGTTAAFADQPKPQQPTTPAMPTQPGMPTAPQYPSYPGATPAAMPTSAGGIATYPGATPPPAPTTDAPPEPKPGDFDAGGQVRLPNGPDEAGKYATFNWVAFDAKGHYFLTKNIFFDASIPLAVKKPDVKDVEGRDPSLIGGINVKASAMVNDVGLALTFGYMHAGAMLLSEKDYPGYYGDYEPGFTAGPVLKFKLGSLLNCATTPVIVYQGGEGMNATQHALQLPLSAMIKLGSLLEVAADGGVYTGKGYSFGAKDGGRIALGASITAKIGPIKAHVGAGVASLLTDPMAEYHTIRDSAYIDVNVKYVK